MWRRALLPSRFAFTRKHTHWPKQGKNVLLVSTKHWEVVVSIRKKEKPQIILDYKHCKDNVDRVCKSYICKSQLQRFLQLNLCIIRRNIFIHICLWFYLLSFSGCRHLQLQEEDQSVPPGTLFLLLLLLDVSAYNAFILWTSTNLLWQKGKSFWRRLFIEELGNTLVTPQMARRPRLPCTATAAAMMLNDLGTL